MSKSYIAPPRFNKKDDGLLVQLYWKSRLIRPCVKLVCSFWNCLFRSTCIRENDGASCDITASVLLIDNAYSRFWACIVILSLHTTGYYTINNRWITSYTPLVIILLRRTISVTSLQNLPVNKTLRKFCWVQFIAKSSSMYTKICLCHKLRTSLRNWH